MTYEQEEEVEQQQPQQQLSTELLRLIDNIKDSTLKIRNLFKQIDEIALKEELSTDDIDLLIHNKYKELLNKSIAVTNNNNPNSSYPYSQYFK